MQICITKATPSYTSEINPLWKGLTPNLLNFVKSSLKLSLESIGFEDELILNLFNCFNNFNFDNFKEKYASELDLIHEINFYQKIVPEFYTKYVIPSIPKEGTILDIGCGTGILSKELSKIDTVRNVIGIDVVKYPEWDKFRGVKVEYNIIKQEQFFDYVTRIKPDTIILTWTLHHMEYEEQIFYLSKLKKILKKDSIIVILEDSYSERLVPKTGKTLHNSFIKISKKDRQIVMSILDWISNRVLSRSRTCPVTFTYRTLEEWTTLFRELEFEVISKSYIGFPLPKNINEPQCLLVLKS